MSKRKVIHVVPCQDGNWAVKKEGADRASSIYSRKDEAIDRAKEIAKRAELGQVKIHKENGTFQTEHTYGKDPEKYLG
jgi:uncharacterized protein YdaT